MIVFPDFIAKVAGRDLEDLADTSGVPLAAIVAALAGGVALGLADQMKLSRALDRANPHDLFRPVSTLTVDPGEAEQVLDDVEAQGHRRYVDDTAVLRAIES